MRRVKWAVAIRSGASRPETTPARPPPPASRRECATPGPASPAGPATAAGQLRATGQARGANGNPVRDVPPLVPCACAPPVDASCFRYPAYLIVVSRLATSSALRRRIEVERHLPSSMSACRRTGGWRSSLRRGTRCAVVGREPASDPATARLRSIARAARLEPFPPLVVHETEPPAGRRQAQVRVVDPQQQPMLGARREHPVRLETAARDQVVDENADVRLVAAERERGLARARAAPR